MKLTSSRNAPAKDFAHFVSTIAQTSNSADPAAKLAYSYAQGHRGGQLSNNTAAIAWVYIVSPGAPAPSRSEVLSSGNRLNSSGGQFTIPDSCYGDIYLATNSASPVELRVMLFKR